MTTLSFKNAVAALENLDVIIYPTETFYAIGGSTMSTQVVEKVYKIKERDKVLPLPVIIGDLSQLSMLTEQVCQYTERLITKFWPGPLTIIMPARKELPQLLTAGTGRVAVRFSSHCEAAQLAMDAGVPLISSSANISGQPPVTRPEDLDPELVKRVNGAVYSGGKEPRGGEASTIVELAHLNGNGKMLHILREGAISAATLIKMGFSCHIK